MGFCFSCCRRRRRSTEDDREPLLSPDPRAEAPAGSFTDKAADILAALRVRKLPSQEQTNTALRRMLRLDVLDANAGDSKSDRVLGRVHKYGPLSERGKIVINDIREVIQATIQFGMEKNSDDTVQDLIYQNTQIAKVPVEVDMGRAKKSQVAEDVNDLVNAIPSSQELDNDARHLSNSLFTLSRLLLTSSTFRLLLSDFFLTSRTILADVAADIGRVAHIVEVKAENVEQTIRPDDKENHSAEDGMDEAQRHLQDGFHDIGKESATDWKHLGKGADDRVKESIVNRLQQAIDQAQRSPAYNSALRTLIYLINKYAERASMVATAASGASIHATATPIITADPHLIQVLRDLRIFMERLASGHSLSPLISHLERTVQEMTKDESSAFNGDLRHYFEDVRLYIERGLSEPGFSTSTEGRYRIEQLYDRGQTLLRSNSAWSAEANQTLDEAEALIHAIASDRTTKRIVDALDNLSSHTTDLFQTAAGISTKQQRVWREELRMDLFGWVLPRVLSMLKTLPMPRVELKTESLEVVVDALVLSAGASFLPDHTIVQNWSEFRLDASAAVARGSSIHKESMGGVQAATRTKVHIDGLRISAQRIGYYVNYVGLLGGLISWEDNGYMSISIGRNCTPGEGISVDIDLETIPDSDRENSDSLFLVNDVNVDIRGLQLSIDKSRHWILNKCLLQPLAGPVIKQVLGKVLASQIRVRLDDLNGKLLLVKKDAEQQSKTDEKPSAGDYWKALCTIIGSPGEVDEESDDEGAEELVETDTRVTFKGVVRNTRTQKDPESSSTPTPSETVMAVGIGAQILPGKGGPDPEVAPVADQAREAIAELAGAADNAAGKAKAVGEDALESAVLARESLEEASARMEARETFERKKKGWRSRAFDL